MILVIRFKQEEQFRLQRIKNRLNVQVQAVFFTENFATKLMHRLQHRGYR
ncbi:hypothetical protein Mh1960_19040 [Mannheimia haemolytica]